MSRLLKDINKFVDKELLPFLKAEARTYRLHSAHILSVEVEVFESPYVRATVRASKLGILDIVISKGWISRLALVLTMIEQIWEDYEHSRRFFSFNLQHPFEAFIYHNDDPIDWCFKRVSNLIPLFLDIYEVDEQAKRIETFFDECNRDSATDSAGSVLTFQIPNILSTRVRNELRTWFHFVLCHEIGHIVLEHHRFLDQWQFDGIEEVSTVGATINAYKMKAVEIDADAFALQRVLRPHLERSQFPNESQTIDEKLCAIAIGISCFDLQHRSFFDYHGADGLYPLPEIRFLLACRVTTIETQLLLWQA